MRTSPRPFGVIVTSPPYNIGTAYSSCVDDRPRAEYLRCTAQWMQANARVLHPQVSLGLDCRALQPDVSCPSEPVDLVRSEHRVSLGAYRLALLLRPNTDNRWLIRARDAINTSFEVAVSTIVLGIFLHLVIIIVLLPIAYVISGDEKLVDDWTHWRDRNLWLVSIGTVAVLALFSQKMLRGLFIEARTGWTDAGDRPGHS